MAGSVRVVRGRCANDHAECSYIGKTDLKVAASVGQNLWGIVQRIDHVRVRLSEGDAASHARMWEGDANMNA